MQFFLHAVNCAKMKCHVSYLPLFLERIPLTACEIRGERLPAVIHGYDDPIDK